MIPILLTLVLAQDVDALLRRLGDEDPKVRDAATAALQTLEPDSAALDKRILTVVGGPDLEAAARARKIVSTRRLARQVEDWDRLEEELGSGDVYVRSRAVQVLCRLNEDAVPFLAPFIQDPYRDIASRAVKRLAELRRPGCVEPLREFVESGNPNLNYLRPTCFDALAALKDDYARRLTFKLLERVVESPDWPSKGVRRVGLPPEEDPNLIRSAIVAAGGPFRSEHSIRIFTRVFPRAGYITRAYIMRAVADWKEGREALRPAILAALAESDFRWVPVSADVLLKVNPRERAPIIRSLAGSSYYGPATSMILGHLKDRESLPVLLRIVKHGRIPTDGLAAAWALGEIADADAVPSLIEIWGMKARDHKASGSHSVLPSILTALGRIGDRRALPTLTAALVNDEEEIRHAAAEALGAIGDKASVRSLVGRLDDIIGFFHYDDDPRGYFSLGWSETGRRGNPRILATSVPLLRPDATVREAVIKALARITGESFEGTPAEQVAAWRKWWAEHSEEFP